MKTMKRVSAIVLALMIACMLALISIAEGTAAGTENSSGSTSNVQETPAAEGTPAAEETPAVQATPAAEGTPAAEETPAVQETPVTEETPAAEEAPFACGYAMVMQGKKLYEAADCKKAVGELADEKAAVYATERLQTNSASGDVLHVLYAIVTDEVPVVKEGYLYAKDATEMDEKMVQEYETWCKQAQRDVKHELEGKDILLMTIEFVADAQPVEAEQSPEAEQTAQPLSVEEFAEGIVVVTTASDVNVRSETR